MPPAPPAPLRVLVVEDHRDTREFMCRLLRLNGFIVDSADSVDDAERKLDGQHVILLDVGMPQRSGLEILRRVREEKRAMRVAVLTGQHYESSRLALLKTHKPDQLFFKPVDVPRLLAWLETV